VSSDIVRVPPSSASPAVLRYICAGSSASLIGIGLARFAYTPLLPSLIQAHWFSESDVVYLSAANLLGYLIGALLGRPIAVRCTNAHALRAMKVLVTLSFLACAFPISVGWFFLWRLLSGVAGGTIMVLVATTVLPHIPDNRKGIASGAVFLGLGLGIAASGTIVPLLLEIGLRETWIGLAIVSAVLTTATWTAWPPQTQPAEREIEASVPRNRASSFGLLYAEYALMALGLVPEMVFLVDFAARDLGVGDRLGSIFWILYGGGAILGPPVYGLLADRLGARNAVRLLLFVQAGAVVGLAVSSNVTTVGFLSIIIGSFPPGIVPLVLAWLRDAMPGDLAGQNVMWSRTTIVFAAFQAFGAYAYSALFNATGGNDRMLFAISGVAIVIAILVDFIGPQTTVRNRA
jgi:predicted MFS family arabinose efflux permease